MINSKLNYIVEYAKKMNSDSFVEGVIHICESKRTIYTASIPEWIKNIIISSINTNIHFKENLKRELMKVREQQVMPDDIEIKTVKYLKEDLTVSMN